MSAFENLKPLAFEKQHAQEPNAVLLDVRTPEEFNERHIPNALNINIFDPNFVQEIDELDREQAYYVYCRSGGRSANACLQMRTMGFVKLYNLEGGILDWHGETIES